MSRDLPPQSPAQRYPPVDPSTLAHLIGGLLDVVRIRYGASLNSDDLQAIRKCIETQVATAERLHEYPLTGADEPAFVFIPDDEER